MRQGGHGQQRSARQLIDVFTSVWEYQVAPQQRGGFVEAYGATGAWAELFRGAAGYRDTILLQDLGDSGRFVTLDRWDSPKAFEEFHTLERAAYAALDTLTAGLTVSENHLGTFESGE